MPDNAKFSWIFSVEMLHATSLPITVFIYSIRFCFGIAIVVPKKAKLNRGKFLQNYLDKGMLSGKILFHLFKFC